MLGLKGREEERDRELRMRLGEKGMEAGGGGGLMRLTRLIVRIWTSGKVFRAWMYGVVEGNGEKESRKKDSSCEREEFCHPRLFICCFIPPV